MKLVQKTTNNNNEKTKRQAYIRKECGRVYTIFRVHFSGDLYNMNIHILLYNTCNPPVVNMRGRFIWLRGETTMHLMFGHKTEAERREQSQPNPGTDLRTRRSRALKSNHCGRILYTISNQQQQRCLCELTPARRRYPCAHRFVGGRLAVVLSSACPPSLAMFTHPFAEHCGVTPADDCTHNYFHFLSVCVYSV